MLRYLTAGESHGQALIATMEGIPAHVRVGVEEIAENLRRRRLGVGRGARMKFEADEVTLLGGFRHGETLGSPIAIQVGNTEWPKWQQVMAPGEVDQAELEASARNAKLTRPRPGHADLAGMAKYHLDDARPVLERASARETAARVALGAVAAAFLEQAAGIRLVSHVVRIGPVAAPDGAPVPGPGDVEALDTSPVRCLDGETEAAMIAEIDATRAAGDTVGGVAEVVAHGVPIGLGTFVQSDRRLDARLAAALMGIQSVKGVEVGDGFDVAARRGSAAQDEIVPGDGGLDRVSNHAGGIEGGMSNGQPLRVRAAFKPISTVPRALRTVDVTTGEPATALHQRSDACHVPPGAVIAEAMVALVLADALVEKCGGDSLDETARNLRAYLDAVPEHMR